MASLKGATELYNLYLHKKETDCTIIVLNEENVVKQYDVHSWLFKKRSRLINTVVNSTTYNGTIKLQTQIDHNYFEKIIESAYGLSIFNESLDLKVNLKLLQYAIQLEFNVLIAECISGITPKISVETLPVILKYFPSLDVPNPLKEPIFKLIVGTRSIFDQDSQTLYNADLTLMMEILKYPSNESSEIRLMLYLQLWATHKVKSMPEIYDPKADKDFSVRDYLQPVIPYLRILTLSLKEFMSVGLYTSYIHLDDSKGILKMMQSNSKSGKYPAHFCQITHKRSLVH